MKKLLVFLLVSTIACAINEESHELDDVSLYGFNPFKDIKDIVKDTKDRVEDKVNDQVDHVKNQVKDQANKLTEEVKSIIKKLDGKNPFEKIKDHLKELEKSMKSIIPLKDIQKDFVGKPLEIFKKQTKEIQKGIHWLKVNGYWDPIMDVVKVVGKVAAISLCSAFLTPIICKPVITFVYEAYIKDL